MNVFFRVDASVASGTGHAMRCMTLGAGLKQVGCSVSVISRELSDGLRKQFEAHGIVVYPLPPVVETVSMSAGDRTNAVGIDQRDTAAVLANFEGDVDWLVVDHYGLDQGWRRSLRHRAKRIMVVEDFSTRTEDCDLLLNQNLQDNQDNAAAASASALIGPRYALLRPEFRRDRNAPRTGSGMRRIFVCFGGTDPGNATLTVVDAIRLLDRSEIAFDVVVGSANPHRDSVKRSCATLSNVAFHCQPANLAALMLNADLAIGGGGITAWERCATGLPSIAWPIAENQDVVLTPLARRGAVYRPTQASVETADGVARHLYALINNPALLRSMSQRASDICDGLGVERVVAAMLDSAVTVRRATEADCRRVYEWRNHPRIREASLQADAIAWDEHQSWFRKTLARADRVLLIGYRGERAIGVFRFDVLESASAQVSIYLDPDQINRGYGSSLLRAAESWLEKNLPQVRRLVAKVRPDNAASHRLFERGGYTGEYCLYRKERLT